MDTEQRETEHLFWAGGARWVRKPYDAVWFARREDAAVVGNTLAMFRWYVERHEFPREGRQ